MGVDKYAFFMQMYVLSNISHQSFEAQKMVFG